MWRPGGGRGREGGRGGGGAWEGWGAWGPSDRGRGRWGPSTCSYWLGLVRPASLHLIRPPRLDPPLLSLGLLTPFPGWNRCNLSIYLPRVDYPSDVGEAQGRLPTIRGSPEWP